MFVEYCYISNSCYYIVYPSCRGATQLSRLFLKSASSVYNLHIWTKKKIRKPLYLLENRKIPY